MNNISNPLFGSFTCELSCLLFQSHVIEFVEFIGLEQGESKLKFIFETSTELVDFALGIRNVLLSIASEVLELDIILIDCHRALLQVAELLTHTLDDTCWNVVRAKVLAEVIPGDYTPCSGVFVLLPPINGLVLELEGGKLDIILRSHVTALEMLFDVCYPVFSI